MAYSWSINRQKIVEFVYDILSGQIAHTPSGGTHGLCLDCGSGSDDVEGLRQWFLQDCRIRTFGL